MGLIKTVGLNIKDYAVSLSSPIKLYKKDEITILFTLTQIDYQSYLSSNGRIMTREVITPIDISSGILILKNSVMQECIEYTSADGNEISFKVRKEHTGLPGIIKAQIVIEDSEEGRIALPEFQIEIRNTMVDYEGCIIDYLITGDGYRITTNNNDFITINKEEV